ncbi:MAG: hypothetical protein HS101_06455 [Planctomycetia bacterium]|nr:hypothetical protein [Planctomycetia bacterium]MCC7314139.1 hypothetical protein [Planctomycetota bacterium]
MPLSAIDVAASFLPALFLGQMINKAKSLLPIALVGLIVITAAGWGPASDSSSSKPEMGDSDQVSLEFSCKANEKLYYVIEQEFREYGGVPPLLSYSTTIKDRRTIEQRVMARSTQSTDVPNSTDRRITVVWQCDRYEATEQGMRDTLSYDSVRHTYPPSTLWELGGIDGSKSSFFFNPATGKADILNITPGKTAGEANRRPLTKIGSKCQLTKENFAEMIDIMGAYWMPMKPVKVGETWSRTITENMKTFGTVETVLRCTLGDVTKRNGRRIAVVEIDADAKLIPQSQPASNRTAPGRATTSPAAPLSSNGANATTQANDPTTSQPANRPGQTPAKPQREFHIDKFTHKGRVEFDLDRGELATMTLQRELAFVAKVESEKSGPMELHSGSAHIIKIKSGRTPPPKPIIVGGPKPPDEPEEPEPKQTPSARRRTAPIPTSRPTHVRPPQINPPATQPSAPTTQAVK